MFALKIKNRDTAALTAKNDFFIKEKSLEINSHTLDPESNQLFGGLAGLLTNLYLKAPSHSKNEQWHKNALILIFNKENQRITVAGTVPDSNRIPFLLFR